VSERKNKELSRRNDCRARRREIILIKKGKNRGNKKQLRLSSKKGSIR